MGPRTSCTYIYTWIIPQKHMVAIKVIPVKNVFVRTSPAETSEFFQIGLFIPKPQQPPQQSFKQPDPRFHPAV